MLHQERSLKISILVPCFNEENFVKATLDQCIEWIRASELSAEIIVVNDASVDETASILLGYATDKKVKLITHEVNKGKGACIRSAMNIASGEYIIIQDSDGEYQPEDYDDLLKPLLENKTDVVYGSRFLGGKPKRSIYFTYALGNKFLTAFCNSLTGLNLTDMETGYKAIKSDALNQIQLEQNRFGIEPELTIKLSKIPYIRFVEVGISYYGRTFEEGKKIKWTDGLLACYYIIKYAFFYSHKHKAVNSQ
jgi:glycosyltransferase involved in cell wall biosynthesis